LQAGLTAAALEPIFAAYVQEARRLQQAYASQITLYVGGETELCSATSLQEMESLRVKYGLDYIVGSVHHVHAVPIDFDESRMAAAEAACGSLRALALAYLGHMASLIRELRPDVVGHLDLLRLLRSLPLHDPEVSQALDDVIDSGVAHGCVFEVNASGLRKGLPGPYPHADVLQVSALVPALLLLVPWTLG
jgi:histidinol-phosphatase (PHP family)